MSTVSMAYMRAFLEKYLPESDSKNMSDNQVAATYRKARIEPRKPVVPQKKPVRQS